MKTMVETKYPERCGIYCPINKPTSEKTTGSIKNGECRDTGNIGHKTQNEDKTKQKTHTGK